MMNEKERRQVAALERIADALETIAKRIESDAKAFEEMVEDGRSLAVLSKAKA